MIGMSLEITASIDVPGPLGSAGMVGSTAELERDGRKVRGWNWVRWMGVLSLDRVGGFGSYVRPRDFILRDFGIGDLYIRSI